MRMVKVGYRRRMRIIIYEDNLLWGVRIKNALSALGHDAVVSAIPIVDGGFEGAIVNLGLRNLPDIVASCHQNCIPVIGHAGHKEADLLESGRRLKIEKIVTNGSLIPHLKSHIDQVFMREFAS